MHEHHPPNQLPFETGHSLPLTEVTREDIKTASLEDILAAVEIESERLSSVISVASSRREQDALTEQLGIVGSSTARALRYWRKNNSERVEEGLERETFTDYLNRAITESDADDLDTPAMHAIVDAEGWTQSPTYKKAVEQAIINHSWREANRPTAVEPHIDNRSEQPDAHPHEDTVDSARHNVEVARVEELFDNIVTHGKSRTKVNADILYGFRDVGDVGATEAKALNPLMPIIRAEEHNNPDWRMHLNEAITLTHVMQPEMREVVRETSTKERFRPKQTDTVTTHEPIAGTEKPVLIRNEQTGMDEPMVRFRYSFQYSDPSILSGKLPSYQEFQGSRNGQHVYVGLDLPESVASELRAELQHNPALARSLVERLALQNNDGSMTEEHWKQGGSSKHPIRPPYEQLPADWTIALVTGNEITDAPQRQGLVPKYDIQRIQVSV